jgi:hypothetical protein
MINYHEKYIKYKYKYNKLKNNMNETNMVGGNKPSYEDLKNINIFEPDSEYEKYFNPMYGMYWNNFKIINNYYNFHDPSNKICVFVKKCFNYENGTTILKPLNIFFTGDLRVSPYEWGIFIAICYKIKDKYKDNNEILNINKKILNMNKIISDVNNIKYAYANIENIQNKKNKKNIDAYIQNTKDSFVKSLQCVLNYKSMIDDISENIDENVESKYESIINDISANINENVGHNIEYCKNNAQQLDYIISMLNNEIKEMEKTLNEFNNFEINDIIKRHIISENLIKEHKIEYFHIILTIAWWSFNNKEGIYEYYCGVNKIINFNKNNFKMDNKHKKTKEEIIEEINETTFKNDFIQTKFKTNEDENNLNNNNFNDILIKLYQHKMSKFTLYDFENSKFRNNSFPDCGETSLRNFINILCYDTDKNEFDMNKLSYLKPNDKLKKYYKVFNTFETQSSQKPFKIEFEIGKYEKLNSRDAWNEVVSNISGVNYNANNNNIYYDIAPGMNKLHDPPKVNILVVLNNLFEEGKEWESFKYENSKLIDKLENGFGTIKFGKYTWNLIDGHFSISIEKSTKNTLNINTDSLEEKKKQYIEAYTLPMNELLTKNIYDFDELLYYINFENNDDLIKFFNARKLNTNNYNALFKYMHINFSSDEKKNMKVDIFNIKKLNFVFYYDIYGIYLEYKEKYENIIKLYISHINSNIQNFVNLKTLRFSHYENNNILKKNEWPPNLEHVIFDRNRGHQNGDNLPDSITEITFIGSYDNNKIILPPNLTHLTFDCFSFEYSDNEYFNNLPDSLTHITTCRSFSAYITRWPKSLKYLTLNNSEKIYCMDHFLKYLPNSLTHLTFGHYFDREIKILPNSLTHLTFGEDFNCKIMNLPNSLTHLTFGRDVYSEIKNFPNSLTHLTFGRDVYCDDYREIKNLPNSLTHLTFGRNVFSEIKNLPNSLTHLTFGKYVYSEIKNLPNSLTHLTFGRDFNKSIKTLPNPLSFDLIHKLQKNNWNKNINNTQENFIIYLPNSLTHLTFGEKFNSEVNNLPNSLTHLTFGEKFNCEVNNLPNSLTHLTFGKYFNRKINNWPSSLTELTFGDTFNNEIKNLPNSLTHLTFGNEFDFANLKYSTMPTNISLFNMTLTNYPINNEISFPDSIIELTINMEYCDYKIENQLFIINLINQTKLKTLYIKSRYSIKCEIKLNLPTSLTTLHIDQTIINQQFNTSQLVNLENLTLGKYNKHLNIDFKKLKKLKNLKFTRYKHEIKNVPKKVKIVWPENYRYEIY